MTKWPRALNGIDCSPATKKSVQIKQQRAYKCKHLYACIYTIYYALCAAWCCAQIMLCRLKKQTRFSNKMHALYITHTHAYTFMVASLLLAPTLVTFYRRTLLDAHKWSAMRSCLTCLCFHTKLVYTICLAMFSVCQFYIGLIQLSLKEKLKQLQGQRDPLSVKYDCHESFKNEKFLTKQSQNV